MRTRTRANPRRGSRHSGIARQRWAGPLLAVLVSLSACGRDKTAAEYLADARAYARSGKDDAAVISLRNALRKAPDLRDARLLLGRLYLAHDDFADAAKELAHAWKGGADEDRLLVELVHARLMAGKPDQAQALLATPRARAHGCIATALEGFVQLARNARDRAAARFEKALEEDTHCAPAFFGLARLALLKGQPKETLRYLQAVDAMPGLEKERLLLAAQAHLAAGELDAAIDTLERAVRRWPGSVRARLALAWADLRTGDLAGVRKQVQAIRKPLRARIPTALLLEGLLAYQEKDYARARDLLEKAESALPGNHLLLKLLGGAHAALGEHEQAIGYLTKYVQEVPDDRKALELLLREQVAVGRVDDALAQLDARVRAGEADEDLIRAFGRLAVATGRYDALLGRLDAVRAHEGGDRQATAEIEDLLGRAYLAKGKVDQAIASLQRAYAASPDKRDPGLRLLRLYLASGRLEAAGKLVEELRRKAPGDKASLLAQAEYEIARKDTRQARAHLEQALRKDGDYYPAVLDLAQVDVLEGHPEAAEARLQDYVAHHPKAVPAYLQLAVLASARKDLRAVRTWLEKAYDAGLKQPRVRIALLELDLRLHDTHKARARLDALRKQLGDRPFLAFAEARLLVQEGKRDRAVQVVEQAARRHPKAAYLQRLLVNLYLLQGAPEKARRQLERLAEQDPGDLLVQARLAEMALAAGDLDRARRQLERLRKHQAPREVLAYLEGELARRRGDLDAAAGLYAESWRLRPNRKVLARLIQLAERGRRPYPDRQVQAWLAAHPGDRGIRRLYADHLMEQGRYAQARTQYERLLAQSPRDAVVLNNLALVALHLGDTEAALRHARRARSLQPENAAINDTLGWVLARTGALEEAERYLSRAGTQPEVLLHLAWVRARRQDAAGARDALERALAEKPQLGTTGLAREVREALGKIKEKQ